MLTPNRRKWIQSAYGLISNRQFSICIWKGFVAINPPKSIWKLLKGITSVQIVGVIGRTPKNDNFVALNFKTIILLWKIRTPQ